MAEDCRYLVGNDCGNPDCCNKFCMAYFRNKEGDGIDGRVMKNWSCSEGVSLTRPSELKIFRDDLMVIRLKRVVENEKM